MKVIIYDVDVFCKGFLNFFEGRGRSDLWDVLALDRG